MLELTENHLNTIFTFTHHFIIDYTDYLNHN